MVKQLVGGGLSSLSAGAQLTKINLMTEVDCPPELRFADKHRILLRCRSALAK